jgi:hypothetical protein
MGIRRTFAPFLAAVFLLGLVGETPAPGGSEGPKGLASGTSVSAVFEEFDRICSRPLWPDFRPCEVPVLVFDGRRTWLRHHPQPPSEFVRSGESRDSFVVQGRHPAVRANTSVELAGVPTASAELENRTETPRRLAALLVHEAFHVFQAKRHPNWAGNEVDLFLYPFDDAGALALRRLESESLRRSLAGGGNEEAAAWAGRAVAIRRERFERLPAQAAAYERGTELKEGLARYVEALGEGGTPSLLPEAEFPPQAVRQRAYASGGTMALLLDRFDRGWKARLESGGLEPLDALLATVVARATPADLPGSERAQAEQRAADDVAALRAHRDDLRKGFLDSRGWKVVVETRSPLFPQNFDPWNVETISPSEVLHTRWIKLGNADGSFEALGLRCLTESAGRHPLFDGVRRATVELAAEPLVEETGETIRISAEGLTAEFRGGRIAREGRTLRLELDSASSSKRP